jgi:hypothetical protein
MPEARIEIEADDDGLDAFFACPGVDLEVEIHAGEPDWEGLLDLLARTIDPCSAENPT